MTTKQTNINDYADLLKAFQLGLSNGIIGKRVIIEWADKIIKQDEHPDYFLIELSLCGQKSIDDIVTLIQEFFKIQSPTLASRVIIGLLHKQLIEKQITLKRVTEILESLIWKGQFTENEKTLLYGLNDEYELAETKTFGCIKDIENSTLRFTVIYKDFQIDNFEEWQEINNKIDLKVKKLYEKVVTIMKDASSHHLLQKVDKRSWWKLW